MLLKQEVINGRPLAKRRRLREKQLAVLHRVVFQVAFSLLLAYLRPIEGSVFEKVRRMSLQYPRRISQEIGHQTDRQTDTHTHRPSTVTLSAHEHRGLIS